MSAAPARKSRAHGFKQADVTRALRGALAAGMEFPAVRIERDGCIIIYTDRWSGRPPANTWDE